MNIIWLKEIVSGWVGYLKAWFKTDFIISSLDDEKENAYSADITCGPIMNLDLTF